MSFEGTNLKHLYLAIGTMIGVTAGVWGGIGLATDSVQSLSQDLRRTQLHPLTRAGILATSTPFLRPWESLEGCAMGSLGQLPFLSL